MLDRSHQWVSVLVYVGATSLGPSGRVGSVRVRMIVIGLCGHGSSGARGISIGFSVGLLPWLNQSRIWNWSQLAARALQAVAAMSSSRTMTVRLISRGLGVTRSAPASGKVWARGTLRPNREPAMPMAGFSRSL